MSRSFIIICVPADQLPESWWFNFLEDFCGQITILFFLSLLCMTTIILVSCITLLNIQGYYMATIVRSLWLVAKWALFLCNDRALCTSCSRHIQRTLKWRSMLWSIDRCQKGYPLTSVTWLYHRLKCTTCWGDLFFFKLSAHHLLILLIAVSITSGV